MAASTTERALNALSLVPLHCLFAQNIFSMTPQKRRRHHVFLFRHCVRSTSSHVPLHHESGGSVQKVSDFTASAMPEWGVPGICCTEEGKEIMKNTGMFIMNLLAVEEGVQSIKVQFVSDVVQRDVDTTLAVSQGMDIASPTGMRVDGLTDIIYDKALFEPLDGAKGAVCESKFTKEQLRQDTASRLQKIPPPDPGLHATLDQLDALGGVGIAGPLMSIPPLNFTLVYKENERTTLEGAINVVKMFGQMLFFSRASGIDPPFMPDATIETVYQLLAWVHWTRAILGVGNVKAATKGSVMMHATFEALQLGQYKQRSEKDDDAYDTTATFFIGHDRNLETLETVLGVKWRLDRPYAPVEDYAPTPPGSAMHAVYDTGSGDVELSFLYPVLLTGQGKSWKVHKEGNLSSTPVIFDPPLNQDHVINTAGRSKTVIPTSADGRSSGLDVLRTRFLSILEQYPGAVECYGRVTVNSGHSETSPLSPRLDLRLVLFVFAMVIVVQVVVHISSLRRKQRDRTLCESRDNSDTVAQQLKLL